MEIALAVILFLQLPLPPDCVPIPPPTPIVALVTPVQTVPVVATVPPTYRQARLLAAKTGVPLVVQLSADWCMPCRKMKAELLRYKWHTRKDLAWCVVDIGSDLGRTISSLTKSTTIPQYVIWHDLTQSPIRLIGKTRQRIEAVARTRREYRRRVEAAVPPPPSPTREQWSKDFRRRLGGLPQNGCNCGMCRQGRAEMRVLGFTSMMSPDLKISPGGGSSEPSPRVVMSQAIELADLQPQDVFYDVGCGDGRVVRKAAETGARSVGIELDTALVAEARFHTCDLRNVKIVEADATKVSLDDATVIYMHLWPELLGRLPDMPNARLVICYAHPHPKLAMQEVLTQGPANLYIWRKA